MNLTLCTFKANCCVCQDSLSYAYMQHLTLDLEVDLKTAWHSLVRYLKSSPLCNQTDCRPNFE